MWPQALVETIEWYGASETRWRPLQADAFNATISAAFGGYGESPADAKELLGWAGSRQGELLARASFGLLAAGRRWARGAREPIRFLEPSRFLALDCVHSSRT